MPSLFKIVFLLSLPWLANAAEFSTAIVLPSERYAEPVGAFFDSNDGGTELVATVNRSYWRYHLGLDGTVQRYAHPAPGGTTTSRFKWGEDVIEVARYSTFGSLSNASVARISSSGQTRFRHYLHYAVGTPIIKGDNSGGFWLLYGGLSYITRGGEITRFTVSSQYSRPAGITEQFAYEFEYNSIYRTTLSANEPEKIETFLPPGAVLHCLKTAKNHQLIGLSSHSDGNGQTQFQRLLIDDPGVIVATEEVYSTDVYAYVICESSRAYLIAGAEAVMFDDNYAIQWRAQSANNESAFGLLTVGPQGQAIAEQPLTNQSYFTSRGERLSLPRPPQSRAGFSAAGTLLISRLRAVETGERLQIQSYEPNTLKPQILYDLPAPGAAPVLMAAALESNQLEVFTVRNANADDRQHWQLSQDGKLTLSYQAKTEGQRVLRVDRLSGAWVNTATSGQIGDHTLEARNNAGGLIFSTPLLVNTLRCEAQQCNFANDELVGLISSSGNVSGLAGSQERIDEFLPARERRASLLSKARVGRVLGNGILYGPALASSAVQNDDGTHWLIGNSLVLADEFGRPIWEKPCPKADCKFILDASAKRAFVATAVDANSTSVQEVERSGELSPAWQIPLVNVTSIGSHGKVLWLRGSQVSAYVVVAFDCQTLTSRRWLLPDAIAPQLQFITSDGAYLSMDYVHENGIDAIKIRRLEFDSLLQNGFE